MELTVRGVRSFRGIEGYGFNCTLAADGEPVAFVIDEGSGGCLRYEWSDRKAGRSAYESEVLNWIAGRSVVDLGLAKSEDEEFHGTKTSDLYSSPSAKLEGYVTHLVNRYEDEKRIRRLLRSNVVFRRPCGLFTVKVRPSDDRPSVESFVMKKYPDAEIVRSA